MKHLESLLTIFLAVALSILSHATASQKTEKHAVFPVKSDAICKAKECGSWGGAFP